MAAIDYGALLRVNGEFVNKNTKLYSVMGSSQMKRLGTILKTIRMDLLKEKLK